MGVYLFVFSYYDLSIIYKLIIHQINKGAQDHRLFAMKVLV